MTTTSLLDRRLPRPRRVAVLSIHTSPLDQPGTGDAGGMNVYVVETARRHGKVPQVWIKNYRITREEESHVELATRLSIEAGCENTLKSTSFITSVSSVNSIFTRRSGLSEPYRRIASG